MTTSEKLREMLRDMLHYANKDALYSMGDERVREIQIAAGTETLHDVEHEHTSVIVDEVRYGNMPQVRVCVSCGDWGGS